MASSVMFRCCLIMITNLFVAFDFAFAQPTRAFFVFGDSLADNGNNHFLLTTLRADIPPYGIDFPTHKPTGRFSNGLNIPDIISEQLGLELTLPYLSPLLIGEKLLVGANFASAGVGILNDTGIQFLHIIHIDKQLTLFDHHQQRLSAHIGAEEAKKLVNKALVLIILGGNDFVSNYYWVPFSTRSRQFSLPDYVIYLISEYKNILKKFYDLGGRKVLVMGIGPMGCCVPAELALWSRNGDCDVELVRAASLFDRQFVEMIKELNTEIGDDVFIAVIAHKMFMDFVNNPQAFGFVTSKKACCGQGPYNAIGPCTPFSNLCQNRDLYAFWDLLHPSEKACRIIVQKILTGSNEYMYPMNLSTVLAMDHMAGAVMLPNMFGSDFGDQINRFVTLIDPKNNKFEVLVERINGCFFLSKGWKALRDFYGIGLGAWLTLVFVAPTHFAISVKDRFGKNFRCPVFYPPVRFVVDKNGVQPDFNNNLPPIASALSYRRNVNNLNVAFVKRLTEYDVTSGFLQMLKHEERCADILDQARTTVNVLDDCGNTWACIMISGTAPYDHCKLGGQWKRFVEARNLYQGVRLRIGAPVAVSNDTIYVSVIVN